MRILVAEEEGQLRRELERLLRAWYFEPLGYAEGRAAWERLIEPGGPRLLLWRWHLPSVNGEELCRRIREGEIGHALYVVALFDRAESHEAPLAALEAGADDVLFLPPEPLELRLRVERARRWLHVKERQAQLEEAVAQLSDRDPQTRLWNRQAIVDYLGRELARSQRSGEWLAVLAVELDGFRELAATHGERLEEDVLRETVQRLRTAVRTSDWVGRNLGARFFLVLPGCNADRAIATGERVRRALFDRPVRSGEQSLTVTTSVGVAAERGGSIDAEELVARAGAALRAAQEVGGNTIRLAQARII